MPRANAAEDERSKPGSDFLQLTLADLSTGGLADELTARIRAAVRSGELPAGTRLPASRVLATDLGVSRGVVTEAFARLAEEGLVAGQGRSGTTVGGPLAEQPPTPSPPGTRALSDTDREVFTAAPGAIDRLRAAAASIDLTPGAPELAAFPRADWLRAERAALADLTASEFGYGDPQGTPRFRAQVARWLGRFRGITIDADEVIVVAGVAQSFALLCQVLIARGVRDVAIEDPSSRGGREQLASWGMSTPGVPVDDDGLQVDALTTTGASVVVVTPAHQFPTGVVLDGRRRRELAGWANAGGLIIEDDYDAEHRYDRPPVRALRATLPGHVCYAGSVSKLLAPALRVGWLLVPDDLRAEVVAAKRNMDLGNAVLPQLVLARMMESGDLERHLRQVRARHRARRDSMITAIEKYVPAAAIHGAAAGLHLTLTLPADVDDVAVATAALESGVKVQPLSWHRQNPGPPGLVLGYAAVAPSLAADGVRIVGDVVADLSPMH